MAYVQHVIMLLKKLLKELEMLSPRLTDCIADGSISALLFDIDQRLAALANVQYNNIITYIINIFQFFLIIKIELIYYYIL